MLLTLKQSFDRQLIRYLAEQMVSEPVFSIKKLKGGASFNYEINHHLIIKLPMLADSLKEWERQSKCAPVLQSHLSVRVPCPEVKTVFSPVSRKEPISGICYEKIEGQSIPIPRFARYDKGRKIHFFEQLSSIMEEIHAINPEELPIRVPSWHEQRKMWASSVKIMIWNHLMRQLESGASEEPSVVCHTDLHPENICVSGDNITGVLDFDSMTYGKPSLEFRPFCYRTSDLKLWLQIYQTQNKKNINADKIMRVKNVWNMIYLMYAMYPVGKIRKVQRFQERKALWKNWVNSR